MTQFSKIKTLLFFAFFLSGFLVWGKAEAADYYADNTLGSNCTGNYSIANRNCSGSDGNAYTTVQAAINVTAAGDTVYIRTGTYPEELSLYINASESSRITIRNYGSEVVSIININMNRTYHTLQGLNITGGTTASSSSVHIAKTSDGTWILDNNIRYQIGGTFGIKIDASGAYGTYISADDCIIDGNDFSNLMHGTAGIYLNGSNNVVRHNSFHDGSDTEAIMWLFGHDNTISDNSFFDFTDDPLYENHIDWVQTLGSGGPIYNYVIEKNLVYNIDGALAQLSGEGGIALTKNNVFRNNIFINVGQKVSQSIEAHWYNNTFYRCSYDTDGHVLFNVRHDMTISDITNANPAVVTVSGEDSAYMVSGASFLFEGVSGMTELNGNTYIFTKVDATHYQINVDTTSFGTYIASDNDYVIHGSASGSNIMNNVFLGCGADPSSTSQGWYSNASNITMGTVDYNYAAGTSYAAKGSLFTETHGVNGGNPYLSNEGGTDAADYLLTANSTLLIDKGTTIASFADDFLGNVRSGLWDIGAYEYSGVSDIVPPAAPNGLNVQ